MPTQKSDVDRVAHEPIVPAWVQSSPGLQKEREKTSSNSTEAHKCRASTTEEWLGGSDRCSRVGGGAIARTADELKVSASKTGSICAVDVDGAIAKEASQTGLGRNVKVRVSKEILSACWWKMKHYGCRSPY